MNDDRSSESRQRTLLADDRTLQAWYRTAFAGYAVAIGIGAVVPNLAESGSAMYRLLGGAFAVLGVVAVTLGVWQYVTFQQDASPSRLAHLNARLNVGFGIVIGVLGIAIAILVSIGA